MKTLTVTLKAHGNPDHREHYGESVLAPTQIVECQSIEEARMHCLNYISHYELSGGNWTGGEIREAGKVIGRISYNGRFWKQEDLNK